MTRRIRHSKQTAIPPSIPNVCVCPIRSPACTMTTDVCHQKTPCYSIFHNPPHTPNCGRTYRHKNVMYTCQECRKYHLDFEAWQEKKEGLPALKIEAAAQSLSRRYSTRGSFDDETLTCVEINRAFLTKCCRRH